MKPDLKAKTYDDRFTIAEWWAWSERVEMARSACYRPFVKSGDLVFDVGANRGRKTLILRWLGARVVAVDPLFAFKDEFVPEFFWRWGDDRDVIIVDSALTDKNLKEPITVRVQKNLPYHTSVDKPWMTESAHATCQQRYYNDNACVDRKVKAETLGNLINIYGLPTFIKVDVEGHEDDVVKGLTCAVPALNMEFHADWLPEGAMAHLNTLGEYEYTHTLNNGIKFIVDWMAGDDLIRHLRATLTDSGPRSWGDIYARNKDVAQC